MRCGKRTSTSATEGRSSRSACNLNPLSRQSYAENGLWGKEEGLLVIATPEDEIAGHIELLQAGQLLGTRSSYVRTSYTTNVSPGRGYTTEAVQLLVDYLFGAKKQHRIQLVIVPGECCLSPHRREMCN